MLMTLIQTRHIFLFKLFFCSPRCCCEMLSTSPCNCVICIKAKRLRIFLCVQLWLKMTNMRQCSSETWLNGQRAATPIDCHEHHNSMVPLVQISLAISTSKSISKRQDLVSIVLHFLWYEIEVSMEFVQVKWFISELTINWRQISTWHKICRWNFLIDETGDQLTTSQRYSFIQIIKAATELRIMSI